MRNGPSRYTYNKQKFYRPSPHDGPQRPLFDIHAECIVDCQLQDTCRYNTLYYLGNCRVDLRDFSSDEITNQKSGFGAILQSANCRCNNDLRIFFRANFLSALDDTSVTLTTSYPVVTVHGEDFYFVWVSGNATSPRPGFREIR